MKSRGSSTLSGRVAIEAVVTEVVREHRYEMASAHDEDVTNSTDTGVPSVARIKIVSFQPKRSLLPRVSVCDTYYGQMSSPAVRIQQ